VGETLFERDRVVTVFDAENGLTNGKAATACVATTY
jgi:hypothetical protein